MKKILALTLSALIFSSVSQARIIRRDSANPASSSSDYVSIQDCSDALYSNLSVYSSLTDRACSYGRTDLEFQRCVISIAVSIGQHNVEVAGQACAMTRSWVEANCAIDLFYQGGQYISNGSLAADGVRICAKAERDDLKKCIIDKYQYRGFSEVDAAKSCLEQFDPVAKARREAELRRLEEERRRKAAEVRAAELRRAEEQRRIAEQRRQQDEQRRQQDEQRRRDDEARRRQEDEKQKPQAPVKPAQPQQPTAPSAPVDNGGGVIVDLPNFE